MQMRYDNNDDDDDGDDRGSEPWGYVRGFTSANPEI